MANLLKNKSIDGGTLIELDKKTKGFFYEGAALSVCYSINEVYKEKI